MEVYVCVLASVVQKSYPLCKAFFQIVVAVQALASFFEVSVGTA